MSFFKKKNKDTTGLEKFLYTLILKKSLLLREYDISDANRRNIITYKYNLSKCNNVVYGFAKYCANNMSNITIATDDEPYNSNCGLQWCDIFYIMDGERGLSLMDMKNSYYVNIKIKNRWEKLSDSKIDYNILVDVYCSVKNSQDIDARIKKQLILEDSMNEYLTKYGA